VTGLCSEHMGTKLRVSKVFVCCFSVFLVHVSGNLICLVKDNRPTVGEFLSSPISWLSRFIFKSVFFLHFIFYYVNLHDGIFKKYDFDSKPDTFSCKKVRENAES
jgi:hypothetical protein